MSFRTVVIKNRVKLEYSLNCMICRGEQDLRINLNEISMVIIQNISSSITSVLLSELVKRKIQVIFCDDKNNPQFELMPYYASSNSYTKITNQIKWEKEFKEELWKLIIQEKIRNQATVLYKNKKDNSEKLISYVENVEKDDKSNREGHAAKVYFNSLFGNDFNRRDDSIPINKYLNYGYSLILSAINREIVSFGYLTPLGIHHIGENNPFNLSCDFMEPLRPLIDDFVVQENLDEDNFKSRLISVLSKKVIIDEKENYLDNAIHLYIQSLLTCLNTSDTSKIKFIRYES